MPSAAPLWGWAPVSPALHPGRNLVAIAHPQYMHPHRRTRVAATAPAGPVAPAAVDPADRAGPDQAVTGRVDLGRVEPATTDPAAQVGRVDRATTVRVDLVDPAVHGTAGRAGRVDRATTDPAGRVDPAVHGTATTTAATSTTRRGATDPHPGAPVSRRGQRGTAHFRRPVDRGTTGRSTTTATTKPPIWNPQFNQFGFNFFGVWIPL